MHKLLGVLLMTAPVLGHAWCFDFAAREYGVDADLLRAIAHVESRNSPWAINVNRNGSVDVGVMQINDIHAPVLATVGISRRMLFDPCLNIRTGAWVLSGAVKRHGYTWRAVMAYNGTNPAYARKVWDAYRKKAWLTVSAPRRRGAS